MKGLQEAVFLHMQNRIVGPFQNSTSFKSGFPDGFPKSR